MFIHLCGFAVNWETLDGQTSALCQIAFHWMLLVWSCSGVLDEGLTSQQNTLSNNLSESAALETTSFFFFFKPMLIPPVQYFWTQSCIQTESEMTEKKNVLVMKDWGLEVSRISLNCDSTFFYYEILACVSDWKLLNSLKQLVANSVITKIISVRHTPLPVPCFPFIH